MVAVASHTVGFAVSDGDRERATLKVMESLRRVQRLRSLQAANHRRLAEQGIAAEALPDLIRDAYKAAGG